MRKFRLISVVLLLVLTVFLTGARRRPKKQPKTQKEDTLSCKVEVSVKKPKATFTLTVANAGEKEVPLKTKTSQKYDFVIKDSTGKIVWQWSKGKVFSQVIADVSVSPKGELGFTEKWDYKDLEDKRIVPAKYKVQGIVLEEKKEISSKWVVFEVKKDVISDKDDPIVGKVTKIKEKLYVLAQDGTAYLIPNPPPLISALEGKTIKITSYKIEPIPGTVDKKILIGAFID